MRQKNKKPDFLVKESKFVSRVKSRWRYPRGKHSPVRQFHKGRPAMPHPGYGAPKAEFGLHSSGLEPVLVHTKEELLALNEKQGALLSGNLGNRKRLALLQVAKEKNIKILNYDAEKRISAIEKTFADKKAKKVADKKAAEEKAKKQKEAKKATEKKPVAKTEEKKEAAPAKKEAAPKPQEKPKAEDKK